MQKESYCSWEKEEGWGHSKSERGAGERRNEKILKFKKSKYI